MLDINVWEIILYIVNIIILFFFLRWLLYKPITKFLNNRTDSIQKQVNEASKKLAAANQSKAKYDEMVSEAQSISAQIIEQAKSQADKQAKQILDDANAQAREIAERTQKLVDEEKQRAVLEARREITDVALQIAQKVLQREISYKDNKQIIDEFFEKVG